MSLTLSNAAIDYPYNGKMYRARPIMNEGHTIAYLFRMSVGVWAIRIAPGCQWGNGSYEGITLFSFEHEWRDKIMVSPVNPHRATVDIRPQHTAQLML